MSRFTRGPVHGDQEGAAWNGHVLQSKRLDPLFVFNQAGDLERCALRPGNVHSADGREAVLRPVLARYVAEGWDYAIRIKGNPTLHGKVGWRRACWPQDPRTTHRVATNPALECLDGRYPRSHRSN